MPEVGQKITVVGTLYDGKQGFWLAFNHWGAYIYAAKESGSAKQNDLYAHFVKVTGTLRHFAEPVGTGKDKRGRTVQVPPEHFFSPTSRCPLITEATKESETPLNI